MAASDSSASLLCRKKVLNLNLIVHPERAEVTFGEMPHSNKKRISASIPVNAMKNDIHSFFGYGDSHEPVIFFTLCMLHSIKHADIEKHVYFIDAARRLLLSRYIQ